jgi:competence protein ComEA
VVARRDAVDGLAAEAEVAYLVAAPLEIGQPKSAERPGHEPNLPTRPQNDERAQASSGDDSTSTTGGGSAGESALPVSGDARGLIDLNHATASELGALPGVGPATARRIIAARDERSFASIAELRGRKVIAASAFEKLKDLVIVRS